jgi:hypothetical protein
MKAGVALAAEHMTADELVADDVGIEKPIVEQLVAELRAPRIESGILFDLEVLICRVAEGASRGRAANLSIAEVRAATVRETLQLLIESARRVIRDSLARGDTIPQIEPPSQAEETESRFVVPLAM